jgi:HAD superfamily hydrolase (TIGR01509 family)
LAARRRNKIEKEKRPSRLAAKRALSTPKAVIFDIGRVIVRLDPKCALAPIAAAIPDTADLPAKQLSADHVWKLVRADEHWQDWQEGRLSPAKWHRHLMGRLKLSLSYGEFRDAWNRVLDPELILPEELFVQLSARCRLALLSNTDPIHAECLEQRFGFWRHFPVRIYSCQVGSTKPSPAIYRAALESVGVEAREAVYVDDMQELVEAARQMGLDAIHFKTRELLEIELRHRHLC